MKGKANTDSAQKEILSHNPLIEWERTEILAGFRDKCGVEVNRKHYITYN